MMNKVKIIILFLLVFFIQQSTAQQPIKQGGKVPEIKDFSSIYQGIRFEKYKLTVIDFWSHSCSACIASFPKLNKLQHDFADSVQFILVNRESVDSTQRMFDLRPWIEKPKVRMVSGDTLLHNLFEVKGMPFVVWVDSSSTVRYLTDGRHLQHSLIQSFLENYKIDILEYSPMTYRYGLFEEKFQDNLECYSYLAKSQYRLRIGSDRKPEKRKREIVLSGYSVHDLYRYAYEEDGKFQFEHPWCIVLRCRDTYPYLKPENPDSLIHWQLNHTYDYDLLVPVGKDDAKFQMMKEDLSRYFRLHSYLDTIRMEGLVLLRDETKDHLGTRGGVAKDTFRKSSLSSRGDVLQDKKRVLIDQPYTKFIDGLRRLVEYDLVRPFLDLTYYEGNVDIEFDSLTFDFLTFEGLQNELLRYGLRLEERKIPVEVLRLDEY